MMRLFVGFMGLLFLFPAINAISAFLPAADDFPQPYNSPSERGLNPMPAGEAAARMRLPAGFQATVFASEPMVQNPIAMSWDGRNRLWVAENFTYSDRTQRFEMGLRDRVLIFEDKDGDGRADSRRVFTDQVQILTGIEVGHGGVWLMCPPRLLFIPDADEDGVPDGPSQVVLDGFEVAKDSYHNFANGIKWGPDGWLYGRCGHSCPGRIGVPGTPAVDRIPIKGGIWRFHPRRQTFEVLCHGTVNPWGHDWDENGELFFINTVIGHLWHSIPGAHFKESSGESPNPAVYERMDMAADHYHFDTRGSWTESRGGKANDLGGGHAHSGLMIYQGSHWPKEYRGRLFALNMHGLRANVDRLERRGAGYIGRHESDFFIAADPFFRGIDLNTGPDGQMYVIDWSDTGECHEHTGVHRTSGRIFQIRHGKNAVRSPVSKPSCLAGNGKLPTLWKSFQSGKTTRESLLANLKDNDEHVRAWAIRLLSDSWPLDTILGPKPGAQYPRDAEVQSEFIRLAREDDSGLVHLSLASTLQRLSLEDRIPLAKELFKQGQYANDRDLPFLVWYGLIPVGEKDPGELIKLASIATWPRNIRWFSRFVSSRVVVAPQHLNALLIVAGSWPAPKQQAVLEGMAEAFRGWRKVPQPGGWKEFSAGPIGSQFPGKVRELSLLFGDGRALEEIRRLALDGKTELFTRQKALETLIEARPDDLRVVCESLLDTRGMNAIAARGLARFDDPQIGERLARKYRRFAPEDRATVLETLVSRRSFAAALLKELSSPQSSIPLVDITAVHARQIRNLKDAQLERKLGEVWGELRESTEERRKLIGHWKEILTQSRDAAGATLSKATLDLSAGRALFDKHCASCHLLFGSGQMVGPDLTGSQRENLDYLLENILDPSATVSKDYRATVVTTKDGRLLSGLVVARSPQTLTLQTATERKTLSVEDIEEVRQTQQSPMPDGLLQNLSRDQVKNLIAYLRHPHQVPLPVNPNP